MSREVLVATWCDPCADADSQSPATEWLIEVNGVRTVVDLCDAHVAAWGLPALDAALRKHGRPPEPAARRTRTRTGSPRVLPAGSGYPCTEPDCGRSFATSQGLKMHRTRAHNPDGDPWGRGGA